MRTFLMVPAVYQLYKNLIMSYSNDTERPEENGRNIKRLPSTKTVLGITFGIFMVIVYVGMGVLLLINFFDWQTDWAWTRWIVGIMLIIYGFFRAWRQYKDFTRKDTDE